jgi:hypothetical protein
MNLSLRHLLGRPTRRSATQSTARPAAPSRLTVERLEERSVPTVNLIPYHFNLPNAGTLQVTAQNFLTGTFQGTFADSHSGATIPVSGRLTHVSGNWDSMAFVGSGRVGLGLELEDVHFNGWLNEGQALDEIIPPTMEGVLTENFYLYLGPYSRPQSWSTSPWEVATGQWS